ncbi:MAG: threonine synthase [Acidimicrobiia bacterium]|nr:threonine synthase [Acidimicrobiia bacterium]MYC57155.1 threonine synthase [Acidimicrobiia bacterium]MYG93918.1 threonine synthase [Acidimicrobiia bacterium]MYI29921.1 threonine synthase [Acidimicrobiia bacterium]
MQYISTRGEVSALTFGDVLLTGLASDGGLYVPQAWPELLTGEPPSGVLSWNPDEGSYADLAAEVMWPFVEGVYARHRFEEIVGDAYVRFDHPDVVPMVEVGDGIWLMELFYGPTLAFKDIALQLVGRLFAEELQRRGSQVTIVGATSGDTGSAAIEAVKDRPNIQIVILHPHGRVSDVQRRQMTTVDSPNVHNVAIEGTFDDCQDLVKAMFGDTAFRNEQRLSAVNSINWARVMAQMVYYVAAAQRLGNEVVSFCVPTGNFGNVFAGYAAQQMGLAVSRFVVASNRNDILTQFFTSGTMTIGEVYSTLSPSMDIQVSSNLERLLFELLGRDGRSTARLLKDFRVAGQMRISESIREVLRGSWVGIKVDDETTLQTIAACYRDSGKIIDPHTAVGLTAARRSHVQGEGAMVVMATAHPAKFADTVQSAIGCSVPVPSALAGLVDRPERYEVFPNDLKTVKAHVARCATGLV